MSALTERYRVIRDVQRRIDRLAGGSDLGGAFSEFTDPDAVWQGRAAGIRLSGWRPWPSEPMARLLFLAALPEGSVRALPVAEQDRLARERQKRLGHRRPDGALGATLAG